MANITPGTGATCTSSSAEGQLHEILSFICHKQADKAKNPEETINVTGQHSQQGLIYSGTYRFSASQTINGAGNLEIEAISYLENTGFDPGTGGTFKGVTPERYALEVLMYLQGLENNPSTNPQNRNLISGSYNSDTQRYEGSFSIPCLFSLDSSTGAVLYVASPYLL